MRRGFLSAVLLCALAVPLAAQPAFLTNLGPQLPGSDFSGWHSEQVRGFATFGHVRCDAMVGDSGQTIWDNGNFNTYKVADHHLILKASLASDLRVTDTDAMILLRGVQDAQ